MTDLVSSLLFHQITICQDKIHSKSHVDDTITHELIHAFDNCRIQIDWNNPSHVACSEIRAATLSGDCNWFKEFCRGNWGWQKHFQECVKRRAALSIQANPNFKHLNSRNVVEKVFDSCFKDISPFLEIP